MEKIKAGIPGVQKGGDIVAPLAALLLDSSLISPTIPKKIYNIKLVNCGDYIQVYELKDKKNKDISKKYDKLDFDELSLSKIDYNDSNNKNEKTENKKIDLKNIIRSKLSCQRLAKCNSKDWKTFITLTFAENLTDITFANKKFSYFVDKIRRVFKNFKYLCIPEFQKRGAVHYHLLSNIDINNNLLYHQIDNSKFLHVKYWDYGFTKVDIVKGDIKKIIGYISKYMTKDIDDRLFGKRRFLYSQNLNKPEVIYFDTSDLKDNIYYNSYLNDKKIIYENTYINPYDKEKIAFTEYLTTS